MRYITFTLVLAAASMLLSPFIVGAPAAPARHAQAEEQALELAKQAVALRSVRGPGNQTPAVAALCKKTLVSGGFAEQDVTVTPIDDTAYLIARWAGTDPRLKPLVISGHMDVVEANPADWERDPFTPVVENGYLIGRGAQDMKLAGAIAIATLVKLKREGYQPRRGIVLEFSGDEETTMKTSAMIADKLANAELVLNLEGGGGTLNEKTGALDYFTYQGAEKTYADFELSVTNRGGYSGAPRPDNAITQLASALVRISQYKFTPELNDLTRAYFLEAAKYEDRDTGAAMLAFAADPTNKKAISRLEANPEILGLIGTTCVVTMISGGHAVNALPQRATANLNCRIFPGHQPAAIMAELQKVAADPEVTFRDVTVGVVPNDASPLRPDVLAAVKKAMATVYPGVPVIPSMSPGASDSMWFRAHHVPAYGASPSCIKASEDYSHGRNERAPISNISPSITYYSALLKDLTREPAP